MLDGNKVICSTFKYELLLGMIYLKSTKPSHFGKWKFVLGPVLFNKLKSVSVAQEDNSPLIEFQSDGSQRFTSMKIVNLQMVGDGSENSYKKWEEIGTWQTHPIEEEDMDLDYENEKKRQGNSFKVNRYK